MSKGWGREQEEKSLAFMNSKRKASNFVSKAVSVRTHLPFLTFLDCLLKNQDMGDLKGYSSSCSLTYFTDEESNPEGFQVMEEPRKETQVS